ncbi:MAG TPA: vWA domain-containing protein [Tepidisphaeraceae bacterium]|nr:vWA domain-containing protein [Tepidisphaeraceae bacterium]
MVASAIAISVLLLALLAEWLHARRVRRVAHLAFGPAAAPRPWVRFVPPARAVGLAAMAWGLVTLYQMDPQYRRPKEIPDAALKRILIVLDVSPSMELPDAGEAKDQMRSKRAAKVLMSTLERISLEQARVSVVAFYTKAKPVVIDTRDPAVVKNIVDDLPLDYAFDPGKTALLDGIDEAFKLAKPWRPKSATLILISDGDTVPYTGMPAPPPSIARTLVIGVGDTKAGKFIDGHVSRQAGTTLRQVATRLGGTYYDANDRNIPTQLISDLAGVLPIKDDSAAGRREAAIAATFSGAAITAMTPVLLAIFGTRWRPGRRAREAAEPAARSAAAAATSATASAAAPSPPIARSSPQLHLQGAVHA